jgi:SAM-dependent methyltransferase
MITMSTIAMERHYEEPLEHFEPISGIREFRITADERLLLVRSTNNDPCFHRRNIDLDAAKWKYMVLEMQVDRGSWGQVFFDLGSGYNEGDSARFRIIPGRDYVRYPVPLPPKLIRNLRVDPSDEPGQTSVRRIFFINQRDSFDRYCQDYSKTKRFYLTNLMVRTLNLSKPSQSNDQEISYGDFIIFEKAIFQDEFPVTVYDPYLVRYGEYEFTLSRLNFKPGERVIDIGCDTNLLMLYLSSMGVHVAGVDLERRRIESIVSQRIRVIQERTGKKCKLSLVWEDATLLPSFNDHSVDKVVAVSSIEHMFTDKGNGDSLAMKQIARVLKPGGRAVVTVPCEPGSSFAECRDGDQRYHGPYRIYTMDALRERLVESTDLSLEELKFLQYRCLPYKNRQGFNVFYNQVLSETDRKKWGWFTHSLASQFNPIVSKETALRDVETTNTALMLFKK